MMLVTLQAFAVAADVHAFAQAEQSLTETAPAGAQQPLHEHQDSQCQGQCQSCCHHGFFHVLVPQSLTAHYFRNAAAAPPYNTVFSSLHSPVLFRPPKF